MKPKKKRKRRKSKIPPKPRSAIDVARNPQPYQFNLYTPPFPAVINHQPKASSNAQNVSNTFRNIRAINAKELERLRGDLTAYRQESQTIFKKLVAFPKENIYYEPEPVVTEPEDDTKEVVGDLLNEMVSAVEENEAMGAEDIDVGVDIDEEIRIPEEAISPPRKKRAPNKTKTRNQLRAELENLPGDKSFPMSNTQFRNTKLPQMRALAEERGIDL
jgi:hypothetical protein|tara:strand:- start:129 stop:779 length:651 start_codon:yes stop_codon:yes gene_type:complete